MALLAIFLPILKQWIIYPIQNYIFLPILNHLTADRIRNYIIVSMILPLFNMLTKDLIKKIVEKQIETPLSNLFKTDSYVEALKKQTMKLKLKRERLELYVAKAESKGELLREEVTAWLERAKNEIDEAEGLIRCNEEVKMKTCFFGLCPNLKSRYQLNKEADKKASAIDKLQNQEAFESISYRPPLQQIVEPSVYSREALPSRVLILNQVMDALKDPNLYMIGVYGLGGVGKTTLAKEVQTKAVEEKMFKRVVVVPVSQTPDLRRIQGVIADFIGLKFDAQEVPGRASELKERLKTSKVLVILDDIWTKLELNDVGIPLRDECKGIKLLLTSRSHDVLSREMGTQKEFSLEVLREEEAWRLILMTAKNANNPELRDIAIKVAKKSSGLPFLVNIVAADLKNKELSAWRDVLEQLSDVDDEEIHGKVHKVLQSSYENLPSNEVKSLFLLCSLFGQSNIPTNHLLTYAMGLGLFKNIVSFQGARDRLCRRIEKLKRESWLLDGDTNGYVKMQDVVQDFARSIAIKDQNAYFGNTGNGWTQLWSVDEKCTRIVLHHYDISELPEILEYPNAELLSLSTENLNLIIPDLFFKGIRKLKVLNLTGMSLKPLPSTLRYLQKLRSLYLHQCHLDDVAIVGCLELLEFLSFEGSYIVELAREIGELTQLKSLDLTDCTELKVISPNILSKLSHLEELYMKKSFDGWDLNGNASITELDVLPSLRTLEVRVPDAKKIPNGLFFNWLKRYRILIGRWDWDGTCEISRTLKLKLETNIHFEVGLKKLLSRTEDLYLGDLDVERLYDLDVEGFQQLKHLYIRDNNFIRSIIDLSWDAFRELETLSLADLSSLQEICDGQLGTSSFRNLRTLRITGCENLRKLFSFSTAKCLSQLQELEVGYCESLEAIVAEGSEDGNGNNEVIKFPQLSSLVLYGLPRLRGICEQRGVQTEDGLFSEMISFPNLTILEVEECESLKYIFKTSTVKSLLQLKRLKIKDCELMEEIILTEEFEASDEIVFSKLDFLELSELPNLIRFSNGYPIEFQSLIEMTISSCGALKDFISNNSNRGPDNVQSLFNEMISFPNLTILEVEKCKSLKYIFKISTVKSLFQLKRLKIKDCELMEEIVLTEEFEAEEKTDKIVFSKLDFLELSELPNLIRFSNGYPIEFQSLIEMTISSCRALKNLISNNSKRGPNNVQSLFNEMGIFPNLRTMNVSRMDNLEYIWHGQFVDDDDSFYKLKSMKINECSKLKVVFATSIRRFQRLEELQLRVCSKTEMIYQMEELDGIDEVAFELRHLKIQWMASLKRIWSEDANGVFTFPNLKSVRVSSCDALEYVFPESIASGLLQLEKLKVYSCKMAHAVGNTKSGEPYNFKWPKLKHFQLTDNRQKPNQLLPWLAKVCPNLEMLILDGINWMKIQFNKFPMGSFSKLRVVEVRSLNDVKTCEEVYGFVGLLCSLKILVLNKSHLGEVFALDDEEKHYVSADVRIERLELEEMDCLKYIWKEGSFVPSEYLKTLIVDDCHSLIKIAATSISFQNLTTLHIWNCEKLENLVTPSTAKTMEHLTELRVVNCKMMAEIVADDGDDAAEHEIIFKQLKSLELIGLSNLNSFCSRINCTFHFPSLEELLIYDCELMMIFSRGDLITPKLQKVQIVILGKEPWEGNVDATITSIFTEQKKLNIKGSSSSKAISPIQLQLIHNMREINVTDSDKVRVVFDLEAVSFAGLLPQLRAGLLPQLRELRLIDLPMLTQLWNKDPMGILDFSQLEELELDKCSSLKYAFTSSVASCLIQLRQLEVKNCQMMETIIKAEEAEERGALDNKMILPSLESVALKSLPKLSSVYSGIGILECPLLKHISMTDCPNLKDSIYSLSRTQNPTDDEGRNQIQEIYQIAPNLATLEVRSINWMKIQLECLELSRLDVLKYIWKEGSFVPSKYLKTMIVSYCQSLIKIANSSISFQNLTTLHISECEKLKNLIKPSTAKTMEHLTELRVANCRMMAEIVADDGDDAAEHEIIFKQLESLELKDLPSLTSFCSGNYAFDFPNLDDMKIIRCPNMKIFSQQVLTPKLSKVKTSEYWHYKWESSLNNTIQK